MATEFPHVTFLIAREFLGDDGLWNPRMDEPALEGGFQVNVFGSREHYLRLAEAIRQFAEQDTSHDGDCHEHFSAVQLPGMISANGRVRLHVILRKDDRGDSSHKAWFPKP